MLAPIRGRRISLTRGRGGGYDCRTALGPGPVRAPLMRGLAPAGLAGALLAASLPPWRSARSRLTSSSCVTSQTLADAYRPRSPSRILLRHSVADGREPSVAHVGSWQEGLRRHRDGPWDQRIVQADRWLGLGHVTAAGRPARPSSRQAMPSCLPLTWHTAGSGNVPEAGRRLNSVGQGSLAGTRKEHDRRGEAADGRT